MNERRCEQVLESARRREEALHRLTRRIGSSLNPRDVLEAAVEEIAGVFRVRCCGVRLLAEVAEQLRVSGFCREADRTAPLPYEPATIEKCPFAQRAMEAGSLVVSPLSDKTHDVCLCPVLTGDRRAYVAAAAPLRFADERYGVINMLHDADSWSDELASLLEAMVSEVSLAMRNALIFDRLQRTNQRLEGILQNLGTPIVCVRPDGTVTFWGPAAEQMFGRLDRGENPSLAALWGRPEVLQELQRAAAAPAGEAVVFETEASTREGQRLWLRVYATPVRGPEGDIDEIVLSVEDYTESRRELQISRSFLTAALDGIQDFINIVDRNRRVVFANRAACEFAGEPRAAILGRHCYQTYWGRQEPCSTCLTAKTFEDGEVHHSVFDTPLANGQRRWFERWTYPLRNEAGEPEFVIEYCRDVTENREQRRQLGRKVHELRLAYRQMASLNSQLLHAEKMASIGKMAAGLAHQIDSPLSTIFGYASMLSQTMNDEKQQQWLRTIAEQAETCRQALRNLLDFSRKATFERSQVNLNTIVDRVLALMEYTLRARKVRVERYADADLPPVWGNEDELQQLLFNLLGNANDAMPNGGCITVRTETDSKRGEVVVRVADTGEGIPPENQKRIFDPFFTTKARGQGTGLGLAVCQDIVSHHGGRIEVRSPAPNAVPDAPGSEFIVALPASPSNQEDNSS